MTQFGKIFKYFWNTRNGVTSSHIHGGSHHKFDVWILLWRNYKVLMEDK